MRSRSTFTRNLLTLSVVEQRGTIKSHLTSPVVLLCTFWRDEGGVNLRESAPHDTSCEWESRVLLANIRSILYSAPYQYKSVRVERWR